MDGNELGRRFRIENGDSQGEKDEVSNNNNNIISSSRRRWYFFTSRNYNMIVL